ncbi:alpha/beta hydrolase [Mumia sp. DW29H23]|uniref:alpha/beta hydrolase n=1 Tax=Mumia sp. DW29H23 TaxID=3421241 RepID=UPI003D69A089
MGDKMTAAIELAPTLEPAGALTRRLAGRILSALARVSPDVAARAGFELWRRPLVRGDVREDERAVHDAARVTHLPWRGDRVAVYEWGDGARPVLLVHGWRSRASRFAAVVQRLTAQGFTPVSYDALGHGATRGRAGTILDHEAIIRALSERSGPFEGVVAHSLGVPIVFHALRRGLRARRVVAINGVGDFGYLVDAFCAALGLGPAVNARLRWTIEQRLFDGASDIWERFSVGDGPADELLVVQDRLDQVVHPAQADLIAAAHGARGRRLDTIGLGHSALLSDQGVLDVVVDFIAAGASS